MNCEGTVAERSISVPNVKADETVLQPVFYSSSDSSSNLRSEV